MGVSVSHLKRSPGAILLELLEIFMNRVVPASPTVSDYVGRDLPLDPDLRCNGLKDAVQLCSGNFTSGCQSDPSARLKTRPSPESRWKSATARGSINNAIFRVPRTGIHVPQSRTAIVKLHVFPIQFQDLAPPGPCAEYELEKARQIWRRGANDRFCLNRSEPFLSTPALPDLLHDRHRSPTTDCRVSKDRLPWRKDLSQTGRFSAAGPKHGITSFIKHLLVDQIACDVLLSHLCRFG